MHDLQAYEARPGKGGLGPETLHRAFASQRGHDRTFRRWKEMLHDRICPSIEDLDPVSVAGPGDILMDLRNAEKNPWLVCMGGALIHDCGKKGMKRLSDIPTGSLLSLLTTPYRRVAATMQPLAFEGETRGLERPTTYRAVLLPLSSDGERVDFIQGSISWREPADDALLAQIRNDAWHVHPSFAAAAGSL